MSVVCLIKYWSFTYKTEIRNHCMYMPYYNIHQAFKELMDDLYTNTNFWLSIAIYGCG